jgi:hypothetical protein
VNDAMQVMIEKKKERFFSAVAFVLIFIFKTDRIKEFKETLYDGES